ncbi:MAG: hypothetical protein LBG70_03430, partial [Bifidobacteriaceae bacterium]|nr:hypothetical protein [Bifidobacteriaceae bacterium]
LAQGHSWQQAWANYPPEQAEIVQQVRQVLRLAWCHGAAGAPLLIGLTARLRRRAKRQAIQAAGRLSVTLMLPLGLCYLPAFVALGLIPVVLSLASGLWLAS